MSSIDDPGAVEKVIERLKDEIRYLHKTDVVWKKMPDDDCDNEILVTYRHDLIRTFLRSLSYSIIRNDPSKLYSILKILDAINFTQNFIANSRKVLDSCLIQNEMIQFVFNENKTKPEEYLIQNIDPIIL